MDNRVVLKKLSYDFFFSTKVVRKYKRIKLPVYRIPIYRQFFMLIKERKLHI